MDWEEIELKDIIDPLTPERAREIQKAIDDIHEAGKAAERDRHKIIVGWSSPSGLIPYASPITYTPNR